MFTDNERPVFQTALSSRSVNTDPGLPSAVLKWDPVTAVDNSGSITLTSNFQSGDTFPIGNTTIVYSAIDQSDNVAITGFTVTVEGNLFYHFNSFNFIHMTCLFPDKVGK